MQKNERNPLRFVSKRVSLMHCLLTVALLGIVVRSFFSAVPPRAYPVLSTAGWTGVGPQYAKSRPYQWLANGDLAYVERDPQGALQVCYQKMDARGPVGVVRHGPHLPLQATACWFYPSPDEKWIAYLLPDAMNAYQAAVISADGKTTKMIAPARERFIAWLSDSRSFVTRCDVPHSVLKVHHLGSTRTETIAGHPISAAPVLMDGGAMGSEFLIGGLLGPSPGLTASVGDPSIMTLRCFRVSQPDAVSQRWRVPVPTDNDWGRGFVSPDHRQILWMTEGQHPSAFTQWSTGLIPSWRNTAKMNWRFFISDLHGNNRHPILTNIAGESYGIEPRWTPDSKHLSYIYGNQLCLVAVE
ncbi:MAG: hypothetical protein JWL77_4042 [Chthonomonadaceae bacterium]|nr:hypothetical protein [Chthonomonadaceae bacterium]